MSKVSIKGGASRKGQRKSIHPIMNNFLSDSDTKMAKEVGNVRLVVSLCIDNTSFKVIIISLGLNNDYAFILQVRSKVQANRRFIICDS